VTAGTEASRSLWTDAWTGDVKIGLLSDMTDITGLLTAVKPGLSNMLLGASAVTAAELT